jgi:hypothetical protein
MEIIKHQLNCYYILASLPEHNEIKDKVLFEIENNKQDSLFQMDQNYTDSISKVDWNREKDFERPWVKIALPPLLKFFEATKNLLEYDELLFHDIWFQQYINNDTHGWHTHAHNFTAVYYLELDKASPKTELIDPFYGTKIIPNVKEGDVLVFPSFVVHKAPTISNNIRKTIVSCNLSYINPSAESARKYNND